MMRRNVVFLVCIGFVAVFVTSFFLAGTQSSRIAKAAAPNMVTAAPLYDGSDLMAAASDVANKKEFSNTPEVTLDVQQDGDSVTFVATNSGDKTVNLPVNRWLSRVMSESLEISFPQEKEQLDANDPPFELGPGDSIVVKKFELEDYAETLETHPGIYTFRVDGMYWSKELQGNDVALSLRADVTIGYDIDRILSAADRILKTENMQISVDGNEETFAVGSNSSKRITFYLHNDQESEISSLVSGFDLLVWNAEDRTLVEGMRSISELDPSVCEYLKPGETTQVTAIELSDTIWPLGENGIAEQLGSQTPPPGLYIVDIEVYTNPCDAADGAKATGGTSSLIAAFEVSS